MEVPRPGAARSFWLQEALEHDPGEPTPPLDRNVVADVCIVGGGFAGLWTAVRLIEREPGLRIAIVEQDIVGGGASGRNGGFVSSSWYDAAAIVSLYGLTEGRRYLEVLSDSVGKLGAFADANGIDCWFHHDGVLAVRTGDWQEPFDGREGESLRERLGHAPLPPLDGPRVRAMVDSPRFIDGRYSPDGGVVQPARLARGLRRFLLERGVHIFERTQMLGLERSRPAVVRCRDGAVKADRVVLTTGAWAAGMRPFTRSFGVIADYVVATEPIPELLEKIGWTNQMGIADARDWLYYLRPTDDGRIVIGGGAGSAVYGGNGDGRAANGLQHFAEAPARGLLWMFPQLEGVRFTHAWGGPIDQTPTFLPFYRTLEPGNIHAGLGYSGHGVVQTYVGGHILAATALDIEDEWTSLAVNQPEASKAPPEPLRYPLVWAAAYALEHGDAREDDGGSRGRFYGLVGGAPLRHRERVVRRGPQ